MTRREAARPNLHTVEGRLVVHAPPGRGEELRLHLAAHNIGAAVSRLAVGDFDGLELEPDADPAVVQAILDHWEG
jgi:hypothetical protein